MEPRNAIVTGASHGIGQYIARALAARQMNLLLSRLGEAERRWYAAVEANRLGHGGTVLVSQITGLDEKTIRQGQADVAGELVDAPIKRRQRRPGGGRPPVEKKIRPS